MISINMLTILFLAVAIAILASAIVWALLDARERPPAKRRSSARSAKPHKQISKVQGG